MNQEEVFHPPRFRGLLIHLLLVILSGSGGGVLFLSSLDQQVASQFLLEILVALVLLAPVPLLVYRGYSLMQSGYRLSPDGLRLRWGLRSEDIPLDQVEWVRLSTDLGFRVPMPVGSILGVLRGNRQSEELGLIEYMASDPRRLLVVATPRCVYAISPSDTVGFMSRFRDAFERGSLTPLSPLSSQPATYARRIWEDRPARVFILSGFILSAALLAGVVLLIPTLGQISLGYDTQDRPLPPSPAEMLLLLPVLSGILYVVDLVVGLFFYRSGSQRPAAYLVWCSGILTPLMLALGIILIITKS